jgi:hypothetical protein
MKLIIMQYTNPMKYKHLNFEVDSEWNNSKIAIFGLFFWVFILFFGFIFIGFYFLYLV